ncbi:mesoderm posterior ba [Pangasianodon hypophthalmus]|uniref:mesoderm posterior ba n=1 Tax=Pangasianodon hypophthalmus TaxID=310915 RepID=UPI00147FA83C|nr:mesoderm posterior ba [Pangasianodon hypophthalmus]
MDSSSVIHHPHSRWSSPSSDSELYSVSSPETVSPAPSMDLNCSPSYQPKLTKLHKATSRLTKTPGSPSGLARRTRRSRLKNPSEQRQNASEKEKLRMRDLTKALHHLRTYLPPSVAPVGQTLTKIETLRLTIRYISYLSAQLGLSEEYLSQRKQMSNGDGWRSSPEILGYFQCRSTSTEWGEGQVYGEYAEQHQTASSLEYSEQGMDMSQYSTQLSEPKTDQIYSSETNTFQQQQCAQFTQSCQVYGYQLVPPAFWS